MTTDIELPSNLTGLVVRGAGLAAGGQALTSVLSLGSYFVLARLATPAAFGELAAGSIVVGIGLLVSESGMLGAIVQRQDRVDEAASTAFFATLLSGIGFALVAVLVAPLVGAFFHSGTITAVAAALSGTIVLRQLTIVPDALLQRRFSFLRRVVLDPAAGLAFAAAAIAGTALGLEVWGLVIGVYASAALQVVLAWGFVRWRPRLADTSFGMWRELARFGRHVIAAEGVRRLRTEGCTAIIGRGLGSDPLGQYSLSLRAGTQPLSLLVNGVSYVVMPALARLAVQPERFRAAALRSLRWTMLLICPVSALLLLFGEPLVRIVFGDRWGGAGRALAAMSASSIGGMIVSVGSETWKAAGVPHWLPRVHSISFVVVVGSTLALLPFGLTGAGLALSLGGVVSGAYAVHGIARTIGASRRTVLSEIWPPVVAAAATAGVLLPLGRLIDISERSAAVGLLLIAGGSAVAVVLYAALVAAFRPSLVGQAGAAIRSRLAARALT
jgi:O-antigen/teichoic acid export membrane protein